MKKFMFTILLFAFFASAKKVSAQEVKGWLLQTTMLNAKEIASGENGHLLLENTGKAAFLEAEEKEISYHGTWKEKDKNIDISYFGSGNITLQYMVIEKTADSLVIERTEGSRTVRLCFKKLG